MRFKLRQMEVFRAVVLGGSITNAAKLLNVSQPAISRMVAHTESSLGVELFKRSRGRLVPTTEALLLLEQVEKVHSAALQANVFVENLASEISGTLRIGVSACLSTLAARALITPFTRVYPQVEIDFHTMLLSEMPIALLSDQIDLSLSVMPLDHANIDSREVSCGRMVLLVPEGHELAGRGAVSLEDIARHPQICHSESIAFGAMTDAAFGRIGVQPRRRCTIHHTKDAFDLVKCGIGIAIIDPYTAVSNQLDGVRLVRIEERIETRPAVNHVTLREPRSEVNYMMTRCMKSLIAALPE